MVLMKILFATSLIFVPAVAVEAANNTELMEAFALRVYVETDDEQVHQWSYDSPSYYEYQHNNAVLRNEEAKGKVERMTEVLNINEHTDSEQLARRLKAAGFTNVTHIDVRYRDEDSALFTWQWKKEG
ncbi:hypothetical protein B0H94_108187 [Salsuginibacillus halophilus]|uniref:Uncharacterized protein n=1 Tax=Salsuginibacillus halophilus TaxID=517424 RepID=A0A2P8HED9_9BACI|nr:hypothetical protein [Salsuginibacillus halophilus]PSL44574.1 hypothetical protein B0H94_108187 [Salsuginibacillus halophilus]